MCSWSPVHSLDTQSFQSWLVRLPVRSGGIGLRLLVDTSPAPFVGGVEMALPHFVGEKGICRMMETMLGDFLKDNSRWATLFSTDCRTGKELALCWEQLQQEAR